MNGLLRFRESIKSFYAGYDVYIRPILKFALALLIFMEINEQLGYLSILNNIFVVIVLAVICAILPLNGTVVIGAVMIVAHCFFLGTEVGAFALILYLLMLLLYFRFVPRDALAILLTPIAFRLRVPAMVPVSLGLFGTPVSAVSAAFGVISWEFVQMVTTVIEPMKNTTDSSLLDVLQIMPKTLISRDMVILMITFVIVVLAVCVVRKLITTFNWEIAVIVGAALYLVLSVGGSMLLGTEIDYKETLIGIVITVIACLFLEFFVFSVRYKGSQYLQFEDDHYYYFVKAVPKLIAADKEDRFDDFASDKRVRGMKVSGGEETEDGVQTDPDEPEMGKDNFDDVDFKSKLEESLKNL